MKKANHDVREKILESGLKQWQIAKVYGLSEGNFSRLLRCELPNEKKTVIFQIINNLLQEMGV